MAAIKITDPLMLMAIDDHLKAVDDSVWHAAAFGIKIEAILFINGLKHQLLLRKNKKGSGQLRGFH